MDLAEGVHRERQAEQEAGDTPPASPTPSLWHEHAVARAQIESIEGVPRPQRLPQRLATPEHRAASLHSHAERLGPLGETAGQSDYVGQRLLWRGHVENRTHRASFNESPVTEPRPCLQ